MNIPRFSVKNPLPINLLTAFAVGVGIFSAFTIQKEAFPPVTFDIVTVLTTYPGASPEVVEKFVSIKLEDELKSVDGVDEMTSISAQNISLIALQLDPDERDRRKIIDDIQRAVDRVKDLPDEIEDNPVVSEIDARKFPVITVSLGGLPYAALQTQAKVLEDRLLNIPDVGSVTRLGYHDPEIWVEIDPDKAHLYYVSLSDVMRALRERNINLTGGDLDSPEGEINIRTDGEFAGSDEISQVIIRSNDQGKIIRISDVAGVSESFEDDNILYSTNGEESINLMAIKKTSGDVLKMVDKIKETVSEFRKEASDDLEISYIDDFSYYVKRRLKVLLNNGGWGFLLILVFLFLVLAPPIAATAAIDIPITFLITVALMRAMGMSINLMTMFGMIMVLGLLVDDAIIMAENVFRHIEKGGHPYQAAVDGANEVIRPVTAAVLTSICAYLPLAFMTGIIGQFVSFIPLVVSIALFISWLTTLFLIPTHAAEFTLIVNHRFLEKKKHWFDGIRDGYMSLLEKAIRFRYWVAGGIVLFIIFTVLVAMTFMKFILFSSHGVDEFFIRAETEIGTSLEKTRSRLKPIEEAVDQLSAEELENYTLEVGVSRDRSWDPQTQYGSHLAQMHVYLTPYVDRKRNAFQIVTEIEERIKDTPGLKEIRVDQVRPGPPVGKAVEAKIRGDDFEVLRKVAQRYKDYLKTLPGVLHIDDDFERGKDELNIVLNRDRIARAGLSYQRVAQEVRNAFEGGIATIIQTSDEEIGVRVKFPEEKTRSVEALERMLIPNPRGNLVPLREIASFEKESSIAAIKRFDRKRLVTVFAEVDENVTTSMEVNGQLMRRFRDIRTEFPGIDVVYGGEREKTMESLMSLLTAFIAALFLIFCIIAIQFRSLIQPPIVMLTIPLGLLGVTWALILHRQPFSFLSIMGFIGLSGVVVNDSIVMIDFMNKLRRKGVKQRESIIEACRMRFRAIFIAALTTVGGMMPMAYGWGGDDPFVKPMALAFTWGIACASAITLFAIPCFYAIADDFAFLVLKHGTVRPQSASQELV